MTAEIPDAEIELYINRRLPEERRKVVEDYLRRDLNAAQRVGAYTRHADALRGEFGPIADFPLPALFDRAALECRFVIPAFTSSWLPLSLIALAAFGAGLIVGLYWSNGL